MRRERLVEVKMMPATKFWERDALVGHPLGDATRSCKILVLIDKTFLVSDSLSTTSSHRLSSIPANTR